MRRITRFTPDFTRTATGYVFLDWLTRPYWRFRAWFETRRFERASKQHGVIIPRKVED